MTSHADALRSPGIESAAIGEFLGDPPPIPGSIQPCRRAGRHRVLSSVEAVGRRPVPRPFSRGHSDFAQTDPSRVGPDPT